jgi:hypothetical protein
MRTNAVSSSQAYDQQDIDYNCIQSLRAYAIRTQTPQYEEDYEQEENQQEQSTNPEDADWDQEQYS